MAKYTISQISRTLDKLFKAGFNTDKLIINMKLRDFENIMNLTPTEMKLILDFRKAVREKRIIAFLSGIE